MTGSPNDAHSSSTPRALFHLKFVKFCSIVSLYLLLIYILFPFLQYYLQFHFSFIAPQYIPATFQLFLLFLVLSFQYLSYFLVSSICLFPQLYILIWTSIFPLSSPAQWSALLSTSFFRSCTPFCLLHLQHFYFISFYQASLGSPVLSRDFLRLSHPTYMILCGIHYCVSSTVQLFLFWPMLALCSL